MNPYQLEEISPVSWYAISIQSRFKIYKALCNNRIYVKSKLSDDYYLNTKPKLKEYEFK